MNMKSSERFLRTNFSPRGENLFLIITLDRCTEIYLDSKTLFPFGRNDLFFTPNGVALPLCSVCYRLIRLRSVLSKIVDWRKWDKSDSENMYKVCMKLYKIILNIEMWKNEINEMRSVRVNKGEQKFWRGNVFLNCEKESGEGIELSS